MEKRSEKPKYVLLILFSFWILIFPAYLYFSTLDDLDIVSFCTYIGNIDQEDSIPSLEKKEKIVVLTVHIKHIVIAHLPFVRIPNLSYQLPSLSSKALVLRC
jgi:hypothetical protein